MPKDKAKNLYHFFKKWAPEIYGDVDDISGCEQRGLEPINTDDEYDLDDDDDEVSGVQMIDSASAASSTSGNARRRSYQRTPSNALEGSIGHDDGDNKSSLDVASANRQRFWRRSPLHFLKLVEDHFSTEWNVSVSHSLFSVFVLIVFWFRFRIHRKSTVLLNVIIWKCRMSQYCPN